VRIPNRASISALLTACVMLGGARGAAALSTASDEFETALRAKPDLERGAALFATCAACHGANGAGASDGSVPVIAGQYVTVILAQLVDFRQDRRVDIRMQHMVAANHLATPQQLADVAAYAASLPLPPVRVARASPAQLTEGSATYERLCRSCHRAAADGNAAERVPRLAGQHVEYLIRQLYDALEGRRPAMGRDHARTLARLEPAQIASLAAYLASLDANQH
jgi:cytochrome c553